MAQAMQYISVSKFNNRREIMKTLFTFLLVLSLGNVFAEDQVSTDGTICADRASGKMATSVGSEDADKGSDESAAVTN